MGRPVTEHAGPAGAGWTKCTLSLRNTGRGGGGHHGSDVFRLEAAASGGWTTWLPNELATAETRDRARVEVWAKAGPGADRRAHLRLTATSESDPSKSDSGTCRLR